MKKKLIPILTCIFIVATVIINTLYINSLRGYLSDCRFECNHLQTKIWRLEELGEFEVVLNQILSDKDWAWLRAANEQIRQNRHREFERVEQPLLTEKEIDG